MTLCKCISKSDNLNSYYLQDKKSLVVYRIMHDKAPLATHHLQIVAAQRLLFSYQSICSIDLGG